MACSVGHWPPFRCCAVLVVLKRGLVCSETRQEASPGSTYSRGKQHQTKFEPRSINRRFRFGSTVVTQTSSIIVRLDRMALKPASGG
jgi:hypothetical protein